MRKVLVLLSLVFAWAFTVNAQPKQKIQIDRKTMPTFSTKSMASSKDIICYGKSEDLNTVVPAPAAYEQWKKADASRTNSNNANFEVTYVGFPADNQAKNAFQKAVDIWSTLIESSVTIRIRAEWLTIQDEDGNTNTILGQANPGSYFVNSNGAQKLFSWYPVALAEKMAREELNDPEDFEIYAFFNKDNPNWYFGIDGVPRAGKTDFVTVVLHEIGHGLGVTKSFVDDPETPATDIDISAFFTPLHTVYDFFLENSSGQNLVSSFLTPSSDMNSALTSGALYFKSTQLEKPASGPDNRARLYAPGNFENGSSVAHLDETTYNLSLNALMTPVINTAEVHHDPGPVTLKMLADMGWVNTLIQHTPLTNTENVSSPYVVKATMVPDQLNGYGYDANQVILHYTTNGETFSPIPMVSTGTPNEYSASLPNTGSAITYGYYISVVDNLNRTIFSPGIYTEDGEDPINYYYLFEAGPDTRAPYITHSPIPFILNTESELKVEAIISDNIGIQTVSLDYQIKGVTQTSLPLTLKPNTDSTYMATVTLPALQNGDKITYRIRAKDSSVAQNESALPSISGFYTVNVVALQETQDTYSNDFNTPTNDFFGDNLFSITTPAGFSNGAIHTSHPYPDGTGSGDESSFIYQLGIPIRIKEVDATIRFDEIVLVEPGENGVDNYLDFGFWDYVIVEGSKDGGITWLPFLDGYDSRDNADWEAQFNSSVDTDNNSTAQGSPGLFRSRTIDMKSKGNFTTNDVVVIRFRLLADQAVHGWGWAIDNLKIQIDDVAPILLHKHYDFVQPGSPTMVITTNATDNAGISKLYIDYRINNDPLSTQELAVTEGISDYTLNLTINEMVEDDVVEYRIRCEDISGNASSLPVSGFFTVPAITIADAVSQYISDFNSANTDFVGNFFTISQPTGLNNGAIHTTHPYPNGFGLTNSTSNFIYMLKKPITISGSNPYMLFDEIGLVEYTGSNNKDQIVVEGSKDNGVTWQTLLNPYSAAAYSSWKTAYNIGSTPTSSLYRSRLINLTSSGKFSAGEKILIRFRLSADASGNGWGWAIDNLNIQSPVTGVEKLSDKIVSVYPNPVTHGLLTVELEQNTFNNPIGIQILNGQGQTMLTNKESFNMVSNRKVYDIGNWSEGIYFLRIDTGSEVITKKIIKTK